MANVIPPFRDEEFVKELFKLTMQKLSATHIARRMNAKKGRETSVGDETIRFIWARYGGKIGFVRVMKGRKKQCVPLAEPERKKNPPLFNDEELCKLAQLLRKRPWRSAIYELHLDGRIVTESQAQAFIARKCGNMTAFFEQFGKG